MKARIFFQGGPLHGRSLNYPQWVPPRMDGWLAAKLARRSVGDDSEPRLGETAGSYCRSPSDPATVMNDGRESIEIVHFIWSGLN